MTPIVANSADEWARRVLAIDKSPVRSLGSFDGKSKVMMSGLDENADEYHQTILADWGDASAAGPVSILAVGGPGASAVDPQLESPDGSQPYQGWTGTAWENGPATKRNVIY